MRPGELTQDFGDLDQGLVAERVAEPVVDRLEVIDVAHENHSWQAGMIRRAQRQRRQNRAGSRAARVDRSARCATNSLRVSVSSCINSEADRHRNARCGVTQYISMRGDLNGHGPPCWAQALAPGSIANC